MSMEYAYAVLLLSESGEELNERNLRAVLEAANCTVSESRVKALVAALEGVEVDSVGTGTVASVVDDEVPDAGDERGPGEDGPVGTTAEVTTDANGEAAAEQGGDEADPGAGGDESG